MYTILISIGHLEQGQNVEVNTIAKHLHLSGAFVTIETGKLAKLGYVEKLSNPNDRRRVMMSVTASGRALLGKLAPIQRDVNDVLFECIERERLQDLNGLVSNLIDCGDRAASLLNYLVNSAPRHSSG